jgi:hypothetical protein
VDLVLDGNLGWTDLSTALRNVSYQGQRGKHLLLASISPYDPGCVKTQNIETQRE